MRDGRQRGEAFPHLRAHTQSEVIRAIRCSGDRISPQSEVIRAILFGRQSVASGPFRTQTTGTFAGPVGPPSSQSATREEISATAISSSAGADEKKPACEGAENAK